MGPGAAKGHTVPAGGTVVDVGAGAPLAFAVEPGA